MDYPYLTGFIIFMVLLAVATGFLSYFVIKKHPKTYWIFNHFLILYPYYYMSIIIAQLLIMGNTDSFSGEDAFVGEIVMFLVNPICLGVLVSDFVTNAKGHVPPEKLAKLNMIIKLVHIPAYIIHFVLGMLGTLASIWGIGFVLWAIIIDLITIALSGTQMLSCVIGIIKQKGANTAISVVAAVLSYIYCIDVLVAILYYVYIRNRKPASELPPAEPEESIVNNT
ncbi:MAG: hypothetical protein II641_00650 [Clostridiales bacterium]|nr:hypothetical protein [Clostridiales bacterium]